jgi:hypothetical protein
MNEVKFDKMIHSEHERYLLIEKEYIRFKPVKDEQKVYDDYKSKSVKKGSYKTLLQWAEQVRSDYSQYSGAWLDDTIKVLDYHRSVMKKNLLFLTYWSVLFFAAMLTAITVNARVTLSFMGMETPVWWVYYAIAFMAFTILSRVRYILNKILFYEEFSKIIKNMSESKTNPA